MQDSIKTLQGAFVLTNVNPEGRLNHYTSGHYCSVYRNSHRPHFYCELKDSGNLPGKVGNLCLIRKTTGAEGALVP